MTKRAYLLVLFASAFTALTLGSASAQETLGGITGTVKDASGAVVPDVTVVAHNAGTNLDVTEHSNASGSYTFQNLPVGTYSLTFTKSGFETESNTQILINANRTATVNADLRVGSVSNTVTVTSTPLMDRVDTTNGYVVDEATIQNTPLGTGSFTQLAILAPGIHSDFLQGMGSNSGLGNQAIFANGQRDTSNSFSLNGINTNNLFNGNSSSQVGENRFVLNTGENFGAGGEIQTSTSVYDAIGQALPTPPVEAIQEITVNAAMYDATQGANSGAHIGVDTKSGTNQIHGQAYEYAENSVFNAAPFFYNASPAITDKVPYARRNQFGATFGGPIIKDKLFYFLSYQGIRVVDASDAMQDVTVPLALTNDRTTTGLLNAINSSYGSTLTANQVNPVGAALLSAKLKNGQYLIPSAGITNPSTALALGYDAVVQGPNATSNVDQGIANIDYSISDKDRFSGKYYVQNNPTSDPFGTTMNSLGFPQQLNAGSYVISLDNNLILTPNLLWEQRGGFTRMRAYAATSEEITPADVGLNLLGATNFPQMEINTSDPTVGGGYKFGEDTSFGNGGMYQNQWEYSTGLNWVKGKHTLAFGGNWEYTQLNIINNNTSTPTLDFTSFETLLEGDVRSGTAFNGSAARYYRATTAGLYMNDQYKLSSNITLTLGVRWDDDGALSEKYGRLTAFNPALYSYNAATDTITSSGLEFASNDAQFGTKGAGDTLMKHCQCGFSPRLGVAWSPLQKITIRAGYGIYYDRGEFFSYLSPSAGSGFNGPFGVTLAPPFVSPIAAPRGATLPDPFGATAPSAPPASPAGFLAYLPNMSETISGDYPAGNLYGPFLYGGYDVNNRLPYSQNWTFDLQYQPANNWLLDIGYVGNHGSNEVLPIPFNQPQIATPQHPVNGQLYSYGGTSPNYDLDLEPVSTSEYSGNAPVRVPYIGYDMNAVSYEAVGSSNYDALQAQLHKRMSNGLQFTASYTYSHSLDEQSGLGLFFTGNNPLNPSSSYASSDFDRTHVFLINYSYTIPNLTTHHLLGEVVNGWTLGGQTTAESGTPYSVYDFSGSVGSLYYGTADYITNPIVPLKAGVTVQQAELQGTTGVNPSKPVLDVNAFAPQFVAPGTNGVPPCDASGCDLYESLFSPDGRNLFRAPFGVRFDLSLAKEFSVTERVKLRLDFNAFNVFNHPNFDAPNNDVSFFPNYVGPPSFPPAGALGMIQHTVGSPRFLQMVAHVTF